MDLNLDRLNGYVQTTRQKQKTSGYRKNAEHKGQVRNWTDERNESFIIATRAWRRFPRRAAARKPVVLSRLSQNRRGLLKYRRGQDALGS